jgi:hypothetical protein
MGARRIMAEGFPDGNAANPAEVTI